MSKEKASSSINKPNEAGTHQNQGSISATDSDLSSEINAEDAENHKLGSNALLDTMLDSDPPVFKGTIDEHHQAYAWPGKRTPIIRCLYTGTWFATWFYHGMKLTCLECLRPIDVDIVKGGNDG